MRREIPETMKESEGKSNEGKLKNRQRQTMPVNTGQTINQRSSGRTFQRNNRKVRPVVQIGDMQNQFQVGIADVEPCW